jgi:hypothetical protein
MLEEFRTMVNDLRRLYEHIVEVHRHTTAVDERLRHDEQEIIEAFKRIDMTFKNAYQAVQNLNARLQAVEGILSNQMEEEMERPSPMVSRKVGDN